MGEDGKIRVGRADFIQNRTHFLKIYEYWKRWHGDCNIIELTIICKEAIRMYKVDLNSDLGESFGAYTIGLGEQLMKTVRGL